jgi:hypothetical protein
MLRRDGEVFLFGTAIAGNSFKLDRRNKATRRAPIQWFAAGRIVGRCAHHARTVWPGGQNKGRT